MPATSKTTIYIDLKKLGLTTMSVGQFYGSLGGLAGPKSPPKFADTRDGKVCEVVHFLGSVGIDEYEVEPTERDTWLALKVNETDATAILMRFDPVPAEQLAAFEDFKAKRTAFFEASEGFNGLSATMVHHAAFAHSNAAHHLGTIPAPLFNAEVVIERMMAEIEADLADRPPSRLRRVVAWVKGWFR